MKKIESKIVINASAEKVWNTLMDHPSYSKWNPFILKIGGSTQVGEVLQAQLKIKGIKPMDIKPKVIENIANKEFRWKGKLFVKGLFDGEHYFQLTTISPDKVQFTQGEIFTGVLSNTLFKMIGSDTLAGFEAMNRALKSVIEDL